MRAGLYEVSYLDQEHLWHRITGLRVGLRSTAEFISKLGIVEEEADETLFWMELLVEMKIIKENRINKLTTENNEILAIIVSSIKTARRRK